MLPFSFTTLSKVYVSDVSFLINAQQSAPQNMIALYNLNRCRYSPAFRPELYSLVFFLLLTKKMTCNSHLKNCSPCFNLTDITMKSLSYFPHLLRSVIYDSQNIAYALHYTNGSEQHTQTPSQWERSARSNCICRQGIIFVLSRTWNELQPK